MILDDKIKYINVLNIHSHMMYIRDLMRSSL